MTTHDPLSQIPAKIALMHNRNGVSRVRRTTLEAANSALEAAETLARAASSLDSLDEDEMCKGRPHSASSGSYGRGRETSTSGSSSSSGKRRATLFGLLPIPLPRSPGGGVAFAPQANRVRKKRKVGEAAGQGKLARKATFAGLRLPSPKQFGGMTAMRNARKDAAAKMKKWGRTGYFRRQSGYFKEFAEDWKASRTDAWLRKARRDALLLVGLRVAVWSFILLLIISVNILVVSYMVKFYADLLQLSRSVFVSLAYQLFVAEPVIMLFRVMVFHRVRDKIKGCIATRVRRLKAKKEQSYTRRRLPPL